MVEREVDPALRHLGSQLREARKKAGLMPRDLRRQLGWSETKIARIETAGVAINDTDLDELLDVLAIEDRKPFEMLLMLSQAIRDRRGWWQGYGDQLLDSYKQYIAFERMAERLHIYALGLVPGLFQTGGYAAATIRGINWDDPDDQVTALADVRATRQAILSKIDIHAIVEESVLQVEFDDTTVMEDQLSRLRDLSERPNITIQVVPATAPPHPGRTGPFSISTYGHEQLSFVLAESLTTTRLDGDTRTVTRYREAFERMASLALTAEDSRELITKLHRRHRGDHV